MKKASEYYKLNLEQMIAKEGIKLDVRDAFLKAKTAMSNLNQEAEKLARQCYSRSNYRRCLRTKDIVDAQMVLMTRGRYLESVFDYNRPLLSWTKR